MPENKNRFVLVCQQVLAFALVGTVAVSAAGVVELEIVVPEADPVRTFAADPASPVSEGPVEPKVRTVVLSERSDAAPRSSSATESGTAGSAPQQNRVVSEPQEASGYATVGVTWESGQRLTEEEIEVSVRTSTEGEWSRWQEMHYDPDHEPDPGSDEAEHARAVRAGTDAVVVGDVEDVQVRTVTSTGATPKGLALSIVDPGDSVGVSEQEPAIDTGALSSSTTREASFAAARSTSVPRPRIYSRSQWGADERLRDEGSLRYGKIRAGFVHHTVNANSYSRADVPAILRGIYAYHTQSRGWSDVGYNFLVDRFGRIWEGRYGGVKRPVVGAHTLGYNEESFAMSAIGNFETVRPRRAMIEAYGALMAWKLSLHGIDAADTRQIVAGRALKAINGHRDAGSTACPGRYLYTELPEIRRLAARLQRSGSTPSEPPPPPPPPPPVPRAERVLTADLSGSSWPDLVVRDKRTRRAVIVRTAGQVAYLDDTTAASGWLGMDLVATPGDLDGDGRDDVLARSASTGQTTLYPGSGTGALGAAARSYHPRFSGLDQITGVGDLDGDGHNDVVGRVASTAKLVMHPGTGRGGFAPPVVLSADWSGYDLTAGVDDFDGDGRVDLVARSGDRLYLVPGTARGLGTPEALAGRWSGFDVVAGRGDATGDKLPDLLARVRSTGRTYVYPGNGAGRWAARIGGWSEFRQVRWLALSGQLVGTWKPDLAGVDAGTGAFEVFENTGRRNLGRTIVTDTVLDGIDLLLNVGDWNGDGRGDVMTRDRSSGTMHLRSGLGQDRLAAPVVAGTGWDRRSLVAPVGDVTGDGSPDLIGRGGAGHDRIYPGNGRNGFGPSYRVGHSGAATGRVGLSLWDADATPDTATRRGDGTLWLWAGDGAPREQIASRLRRYDWLLGLGDVDGDGRADVIARRRTSGHLWLIPGGSDGLGTRQLIGTGFDAYDHGS